MSTVEQRLQLLEDRVAVLTDAYERNMEFIGKKLSEHSQRFDRLENKMDAMAADIGGMKSDIVTIKADVAGVKSAIDALPAILARSFDEALRHREKQRPN